SFNAEDEIRDFLVTGVETCALPISELPPPITATSLPLNKGPSQCGQYATPALRYSSSPGTLMLRQRAPVARMTDLPFSDAPLARSEERRVGEVGRTRRLATG